MEQITSFSPLLLSTPRTLRVRKVLGEDVTIPTTYAGGAKCKSSVHLALSIKFP